MNLQNTSVRASLLWLVCIPFLNACERSYEGTEEQEPWSNRAEQTFQDAEVLRFQIEQRKLEQERLDRLGVDGVPPDSH